MGITLTSHTGPLPHGRGNGETTGYGTPEHQQVCEVLTGDPESIIRLAPGDDRAGWLKGGANGIVKNYLKPWGLTYRWERVTGEDIEPARFVLLVTGMPVAPATSDNDGDNDGDNAATLAAAAAELVRTTTRPNLVKMAAAAGVEHAAKASKADLAAAIVKGVSTR